MRKEREKVQASEAMCDVQCSTVSCFFVLSNRYLVTKNSIQSTYDMLVGAVLHKVCRKMYCKIFSTYSTYLLLFIINTKNRLSSICSMNIRTINSISTSISLPSSIATTQEMIQQKLHLNEQEEEEEEKDETVKTMKTTSFNDYDDDDDDDPIEDDEYIPGIKFVNYKDESQLESVMKLVGKDLSEPYSG